MTVLVEHGRERVPTDKQFAVLAKLGNPGTLLVSGIRGSNQRQWEACLRHGWVEPSSPEIDPLNGLQITPDGLRALAAYLEQRLMASTRVQAA